MDFAGVSQLIWPSVEACAIIFIRVFANSNTASIVSIAELIMFRYLHQEIKIAVKIG
jgi:hypothetical protein